MQLVGSVNKRWDGGKPCWLPGVPQQEYGKTALKAKNHIEEGPVVVIVNIGFHVVIRNGKISIRIGIGKAKPDPLLSFHRIAILFYQCIS